MNEYIAEIYATGGMDKVASEGGAPPSLEELSLGIAAEYMESVGHGADLEKTAALAHDILEHFAEYDMSGRAIAHQQFGDLEKKASEGDPEPLLTFFGEYDEMAASPADALRQELAKRLNG